MNLQTYATATQLVKLDSIVSGLQADFTNPEDIPNVGAILGLLALLPDLGTILLNSGSATPVPAEMATTIQTRLANLKSIITSEFVAL